MLPVGAALRWEVSPVSQTALLQVSTLFPSPKTEEGIKGGVVLLRMQLPGIIRTPLRLTVTYYDRTGKTHRQASAA